jgi:hypothetical protein
LLDGLLQPLQQLRRSIGAGARQTHKQEPDCANSQLLPCQLPPQHNLDPALCTTKKDYPERIWPHSPHYNLRKFCLKNSERDEIAVEPIARACGEPLPFSNFLRLTRSWNGNQPRLPAMEESCGSECLSCSRLASSPSCSEVCPSML